MSEARKAEATAGSGPETRSRPTGRRPRRWQRLGGALGLLVASLLLLAVAAGAWLRHRLLAALPVASGRLEVRGLTAPVWIERDAAGSWADGARSWRGLLPVSQVPRLVGPESGRLWPANNRVLAGARRSLWAAAASCWAPAPARSATTCWPCRGHRRGHGEASSSTTGRCCASAGTTCCCGSSPPEAVAADARRGKLRQLAARWGAAPASAPAASGWCARSG